MSDYPRCEDWKTREARKRAARDAKGKQCAELTHGYGGRTFPCKLSATLDWEGKRYCVKHYPPTVAAQKEKTRRTKIAWHRRELKRLEGNDGKAKTRGGS